MSLLYRILYAAHANGSHHKLALRGVEKMGGAAAEGWRRLFLSEAKALLEGSKAPDKSFKDFQNHCLHPAKIPGAAEWGGAPNAAETWYYETVRALAAGRWRDAAYNAGVLSHYYTDPLMPFHTGSSEAETVIHRAAEWSVSKSFERLWKAGAAPAREALGAVDADGDPMTADWVGAMVRAGAAKSHASYRLLIEDYDFKVGSKQPEHGFGEAANQALAGLLAHAAAGFAYLLERACADSGATPPPVSLTARTVLASLEIPVQWVLKKIDDAEERSAVAAMWTEFDMTGKVEKTLPLEQRMVRALAPAGGASVGGALRPLAPAPSVKAPQGPAMAAAEPDAGAEADAVPPTGALKGRLAELERTAPAVLPSNVTPLRTVAAAPAAPKPPAPEPVIEETESEEEWLPPVSAELAALKKALAPRSEPEDEQPRAARDLKPRLDRADPVEKAPSIGPKTAERLGGIGVVTVGDLLDADPKAIASGLGDRRINAKTVATWRDQARLLTTTPGLKAAQAVMLAAAGYRDVDGLAKADPAVLRQQLVVAAKTDKVKRALRGAEAPDAEQTAAIIAAAREAAGMRAGRAAYA